MTIYPTPTPEGVKELQEHYRTHCGLEVDEKTAYEVLYGIMRFLYLTEIKPPDEAKEASVPIPASSSTSGEEKTGDL